MLPASKLVEAAAAQALDDYLTTMEHADYSLDDEQLAQRIELKMFETYLQSTGAYFVVHGNSGRDGYSISRQAYWRIHLLLQWNYGPGPNSAPHYPERSPEFDIPTVIITSSEYTPPLSFGVYSGQIGTPSSVHLRRSLRKWVGGRTSWTTSATPPSTRRCTQRVSRLP